MAKCKRPRQVASGGVPGDRLPMKLSAGRVSFPTVPETRWLPAWADRWFRTDVGIGPVHGGGIEALGRNTEAGVELLITSEATEEAAMLVGGCPALGPGGGAELAVALAADEAPGLATLRRWLLGGGRRR